VDCPLDCPFLQEARKHDRPPEPDPDNLPNRDVNITEKFLGDNTALFGFACHALLGSSLNAPGVVDNDIREVLDSLARTYRTRESGLIYESRPTNLLAAALQKQLHDELDQFRAQVKENMGMETIRDADVFGILVLLQRLEFTHNNGRPRSRAFLDFLRQELQDSGAAPPGGGGSGLIVPA
jgi:hypothetical protein